MKNKKCLIIYNPNSGKSLNGETIKKYLEILKENNYTVDIVATKYSEHATETVANASSYDIVFSIGGDGTLNEVVKGNYQRNEEERLVICPLPSGTCNDVATMLGYGTDPIDNLQKALTGEIHTVDIGTINNNPFAYVVGMGKFMNIPYETKSQDKRKKGYAAYIKGALDEVLDKMKRYRAEVIVDGNKLDDQYSLIMVSNANHIAGINNFHRDVCLNDGKMEVLLCKAASKTDFVKNFLMYFLGQQPPNMISLKAHDVSITLLDKPDKSWCIDGEEYKSQADNYHISISAEMEFLTPASQTKRLFK